MRVVDLDDELCIEHPSKRQRTLTSETPEVVINEKRNSVSTQTDNAIVISILDETHIDENEQFSQILPEIVETLIDYGHIIQWKLLFIALARRILSKDKICYRLFLNAVTWFTNENTGAMRYDDVVKRFWGTGLLYNYLKENFLDLCQDLKMKA